MASLQEHGWGYKWIYQLYKGNDEHIFGTYMTLKDNPRSYSDHIRRRDFREE